MTAERCKAIVEDLEVLEEREEKIERQLLIIKRLQNNTLLRLFRILGTKCFDQLRGFNVWERNLVPNCLYATWQMVVIRTSYLVDNFM
uniref:Uncharacterized protein n=1 Tax=Laticauda laticaudata TaxID=8630 RepID=A0A8C5WWD1_LATLA